MVCNCVEKGLNDSFIGIFPVNLQNHPYEKNADHKVLDFIDILLWALTHFMLFGLFLYPLKTLENLRFSVVLRAYRKRLEAWRFSKYVLEIW